MSGSVTGRLGGRRDGRGVHGDHGDHGERGSATVELMILAPGLLAFLLLAIFAGRVALARQSVQAAAAEAARSASIARTASAATGDARAAAAATLASEGLRCSTTQVDVDLAAFGTPVGTPGTVAATVRCTVDLTDLIAPGIPGTRDLVATMTSPLDTYRERT